MLVAVQLFALGLYLPPVFVSPLGLNPPQTIIWLPVQIAVCKDRAAGVFVMVVAVQLLVLGLYLPPVLLRTPLTAPPHTIISLPIQTAV